MWKIKIDKADTEFSRFIRNRDNWTCQRCHTHHEEGSQGLHNSHFFGRSAENTRFDPENCIALCFACHMRWGGTEREEYRNFMIKLLGKEGFKKLEQRSWLYKKKDRKLEAIKWREINKRKPK